MSADPHHKPMVLHPTDLAADGEGAFAHALKIALMQKSGICILHVDESGGDDAGWQEFPAVRELLIRWGLLESDAERAEVAERLGTVVEKVKLSGRPVSDAIAGFRRRRRFGLGLLVLATAGREGLPRWLHPSVAEQIAREVDIPTLFVPANARPFVDLGDGSVALERVLVPVDHAPPPQVSIAATAALAGDLRLGGCEVTVVHVGGKSDFPSVKLSNDEHCQYQALALAGDDPVDAILAQAGEISAGLIVMTTRGHDGFLDVLRGSVTERVLRRSPCPVLTVPAAG